MHAQLARREDLSNSEPNRYEALLQMADLISSPLDLTSLVRQLSARLKTVVRFDFLNLLVHDPERNVMRLQIWEGIPVPGVPHILSVEHSVSGWVFSHQTMLVIDDLRQEPRFQESLSSLEQRGVRSYCMLPLTVGDHQLGAIGFGSLQVKAFAAQDMQLLQRIAELVALTVDSSLSRKALDEEKERLRALLEVHRTLTSTLEMRRILPMISECVTRVVPHDFAGVTLYEDSDHKSMKVFVLPVPSNSSVIEPVKAVAASETLAIHAIAEKKARTFSRDELLQLNTPVSKHVIEAGIQTMHCIPLMTQKDVYGVLNVGSRAQNAFSREDNELLNQVAAQLAISLENARAYQEIRQLKERLEEEKLYLEGEIQSELHFEEIVGNSTVLKQVLGQVATVSASNATVLILGETGTGKELIARAIHKMSRRANQSFIKLNCAAIPTGLLESELFGHEKGAFTGAISQKVGRLELADGGTLFLDEIGDIPLELQPKLLRVLQDQEFERLGSTRTLRVDVRLIAATNRELTTAVAQGQFRRDLYYRVNVFPVRLPALRERAEDIPLLVQHFIRKFARRMDKTIETIPTEVMNAFRNWKWPGNVRELENFIERSVILTDGPVLRAPLAELRSEAAFGDGEGSSTLHAAEREHILRVLREARGVISGPRGAASRLGLKRTTLQYKMQKLGIARTDYAP
jgi:formate hydrogenlyase transcriptional activator